jgi:hypothetical protein
MPSFPVRVILFLSSYAPLFLIVALRGWKDAHCVADALVLVAVLSIAILFILLRAATRLADDVIKIEAVTSRDSDVMSYIVTYLLPFLNVKLNNLMDTASLGMVLFVIAILYIS